jgi:L-glutamine-phosphate cytidylyltransferase
MNTPNVKQAVILAAGRGSRMGPMTDALPKCLLQVFHQPILYRQLDTLQQAGIEEVIVVTGYLHEKIQEALSEWKGNIMVQTQVQKQWDITNNICSLAGAHSLLHHDFILIEGDVVLTLPLPLDFLSRTAALIGAYKPHMTGTTVNLDAFGNWNEVLFYNETGAWPGRYKTINVYHFSRQSYQKIVMPKVQELLDAGQDQVFYEKAIAIAIHEHGLEMKGIIFPDRGWDEVDSQEDWYRIHHRL